MCSVKSGRVQVNLVGSCKFAQPRGRQRSWIAGWQWRQPSFLICIASPPFEPQSDTTLLAKKNPDGSRNLVDFKRALVHPRHIDKWQTQE